MIGQTVSHYRITAALGAGGMGEVYRATDTTLNREVAIKVLPPEVVQDAERLARFRREAQVLASLNHPNIAAIYGLEEAEAKPFLALELVEGEDLKERLVRGAIPVDEALEIAKQIVEGLEEAHEKGIVHRDLKPANVKLTPDGKVKVLDFGLAKAWSGDSASGGSSMDLSQSPTLAHTGTQAGVILGTAAYMSPEQARGKPVDKRADIWSFGVLLFEMLAGRQLFAGETISDVLAAVLKTEPDWSALPTTTPGATRRLLRRCLERDPRKRLRDIGDARLELAAPPEPDEGTRTTAPARFASRPAVALMAALGSATLALGLLQLRATAPEGSREVVRASIALPAGHALVSGPEITRDGQRIAFVSTDGYSRPQLYTRRLDEDGLHRLEGTEEALRPFFSPDGRWIAFYARGGLFKVRVDGAEPVRLADAVNGLAGHWLEDDTIIFNTPTWNAGLYRINANGGEPEPLLIPDRKSHYAYVWPFGLPGERAVLFSRWGVTYSLARLDLEDMSQSIVAERQSSRSLYTASGHIVFGASDGGDLLALPGELSAAAVATPETVLTNVAGGGDSAGETRASVSQTGTLVYSPLDPSKRRLVLADRSGQSEAVPGQEAIYTEVQVSPDGRRAVVATDMKLFVHDLIRGSRLPLAPELSQEEWKPAWTQDGTRVLFAANHEGTWNVYSKDASGTGEVELVLSGRPDQYPTWVMRDGTVVVHQNHVTTADDIWLVPPGGEPEPWRVTPAGELMGRVSPDDRLMAFISDVSGRFEVYVQPLDRSSDAVPVSTQGGTGPVWSRSGDQLFFRQGRLLMAAAVASEPAFEIGTPEVVFDTGWELGQDAVSSQLQLNYDVLPDGRFLMVKNEPEAIPMRINVIFNWFEELNRIVPIAR